jgi:hypothetical protein
MAMEFGSLPVLKGPSMRKSRVLPLWMVYPISWLEAKSVT